MSLHNTLPLSSDSDPLCCLSVHRLSVCVLLQCLGLVLWADFGVGQYAMFSSAQCACIQCHVDSDFEFSLGLQSGASMIVFCPLPCKCPAFTLLPDFFIMACRIWRHAMPTQTNLVWMPTQTNMVWNAVTNAVSGQMFYKRQGFCVVWRLGG